MIKPFVLHGLFIYTGFHPCLHNVHRFAIKKNIEKKTFFHATKQFYNTYPQLVPFSESTMSFFLKISNTNKSNYSKKIIQELKACNINWLDNKNTKKYPTVHINFLVENKIHYISYKVVLADGTNFINDKIQIKEYRDETVKSGKKIAYRLFKIKE